MSPPTVHGLVGSSSFYSARCDRRIRDCGGVFAAPSTASLEVVVINCSGLRNFIAILQL